MRLEPKDWWFLFGMSVACCGLIGFILWTFHG